MDSNNLKIADLFYSGDIETAFILIKSQDITETEFEFIIHNFIKKILKDLSEAAETRACLFNPKALSTEINYNKYVVAFKHNQTSLNHTNIIIYEFKEFEIKLNDLNLTIRIDGHFYFTKVLNPSVNVAKDLLNEKNVESHFYISVIDYNTPSEVHTYKSYKALNFIKNFER